ncbi:formimidoylglutamase [Chryseobacterium lacus]|uniref:Formimidoylglutamase n=1 Tax=Chryseobacterium lacus TaxID=2058346 RepID=A0A368N3C9_9FLAO|nr:formimidoylglutamase [Chryseobacterium lacus]RCU44025.1 formimidoylglutamase [Chryseobacterium lacus]RST28955.1 formimidoylglutamase [Chryseobacterium lacus]
MVWTGRNDGDDALHQRLFQMISFDKEISPNDFILHGFAVDEGVRRNKGRTGAKDAPDSIRRNMANFPVVYSNLILKDFGNLFCENQDLETAQQKLADAVAEVVVKSARSLVLGGGHEVTFAHYRGLKKAFPEKRIGIINIDAHFDNRMPEEGVGATSGTGFWQIAQDEKIHSLHIGIQRNSNTLKLFDTAHQFGMKYILADELFYENLPFIYEQIDRLSEKIDLLYLTVCMDVFNAAVAPGVSATAYNGIFADPVFMLWYRHILRNEKLIALDVAEVNPSLDTGEKTARLAASLVNEWLMYSDKN